jgi:parvulin-like peptidyl-prolyl isomerase
MSASWPEVEKIESRERPGRRRRRIVLANPGIPDNLKILDTPLPEPEMKGNAIASCKAVHGPVSREVRNRRLPTPTRFIFFRFADPIWKLRGYVCFSLLMIIPVLCAACGTYDQQQGMAVVTVGKRSLTADQLKREMKRLLADLENPPENSAELKRILVERVVDRCRILEYGSEKGIGVSEEEINSVVEEIEKDYGQEDFREILVKKYIDLEEWKKEVREQILIRKIIEKVLESVPAPTAEEIKAYFEAHAQEFKRPAMVSVRQVVVRTKKEAQELARRLTDGERMEEMATTHSISPDAKRGGEVGWIEKGQVEEGIERVIFSLPIGRISPIVQSSHGFHIFQVISKRAEGDRYLPEVASEIESTLFSQRGEAFFSQWLKGLEEQFPAKINKELLEKLEWA